MIGTLVELPIPPLVLPVELVVLVKNACRS
jgi:hypothetical protein